MTGRDVVVVGGGPAGLAAAIVCATHGLTTLLVERHAFPVDKACGEGLLPNGVAALGRIGIDTGMVAARARALSGIRYFTPRGRTAGASFDGRPALGIRRTELSRALLEHAGRLPGLEAVTGSAELVLTEGQGIPLVRIGGKTMRPKLVIGADGLHSRTRTAMGITVEYTGRSRWGCRQHFAGTAWTDAIEVHFQPGFECYVTPVAHGVNVAVLWDARLVSIATGCSPVASLVAQVPALARRLRLMSPTDAARGGGPFDVRVRRPWRAGVLLVGDAAGYVDPLTGEGVGLAFEQAALLSHTVVPALHRTKAGSLVDSGVLAQFTRESRAASRPNRQLTRLLLRVVRHPALVERIVTALASNPALFERLLEVNAGRRELWRVPAVAYHG